MSMQDDVPIILWATSGGRGEEERGEGGERREEGREGGEKEKVRRHEGLISL